MKISGIVITKNEEKNIVRCLKSLSFCDEVIIVDDFSYDDTIRNAELFLQENSVSKFNVKIFKHRVSGNFAKQRNYALGKSGNDWNIFIDADEELSQDLINEIKDLDKGGNLNRIGSYRLKRRDFFWKKEIRYGEVLLSRVYGISRLVKKGSGEWVGNVHEVFKSYEGYHEKKLKGYINHYPHQTLREFISDINQYSSLRAKQLAAQGKKSGIFQIVLYPLVKFFISYFFLLGILDGAAGFVYSFLMSFHSFLVRAKLWQHYSI